MQQSEQGLDFLAAKRIRELMSAHGYPKHKHRKLLTEILNLGETQTHRKLAGDVGWTLDEIKKIADYFKEQPTVIFNSIFDETASKATLYINGVAIPCITWVGNEIKDTDTPPIAAYQQDEKWHIGCPTTLPGKSLFSVNRIDFRQSTKAVVGILDDDKNFVETIALQLSKAGFQANPYTDEKQLLEAIEQKEFDAFVIDWVLKSSTANRLIANIRHTDAHKNTPIILLTGNSERYASDVALAIREHKVVFVSKPVSAEIIAAQIKSAIQIP